MRQPAATLEVAGLGGQLREEVAELAAGNAQEAPVTGMPMIACATQRVTTSACIVASRQTVT